MTENKNEALASVENKETETNWNLTEINLPVKPISHTDSKNTLEAKIREGIRLGEHFAKGEIYGRVMIGYIYDTLNRNKNLLDRLGYSDVYGYAEFEFEMPRTSTCNCMKIFKKFGEFSPKDNRLRIQERFRNLNLSQLTELVSVNEEDMDKFFNNGACLNVRDIRAKKKELRIARKEVDSSEKKEVKNTVADSEQEEIESTVADSEQEEIESTVVDSEQEETESTDTDTNHAVLSNSLLDDKEVLPTDKYTEDSVSNSENPTDKDIDADYTDLSNSLLFEKKIQITTKVTHNRQVLKECVNEYLDKFNDRIGNIRVAVYKVNDETEE